MNDYRYKNVSDKITNMPNRYMRLSDIQAKCYVDIKGIHSKSQSKKTLEKVPLFQSLRKPQQYIEPSETKKPTLIQRIVRAVKGA